MGDTLLLDPAGLICLVGEKGTDDFRLLHLGNHQATQSMVRDTLLLRQANLIRQLGENQPHGFRLPHWENRQAMIAVQ